LAGGLHRSEAKAAEGEVWQIGHAARRSAGWELQFADETCEVLVVGERVVNVIAFFDGVPVRKSVAAHFVDLAALLHALSCAVP